MSYKFSKAEREEIVSLDFDDLMKVIVSMNRPAIGANSKFLLDEVARRINLSMDAIAIVLVNKGTPNKDGEVTLHVWSKYSEDRIGAWRAIQGRKWNGTSKCNQVTVADSAVAAKYEEIKGLFAKLFVIEGNSYREESARLNNIVPDLPPYGLIRVPIYVMLGNVLNAYLAFRPEDNPERLSLLRRGKSDGRVEFDKDISVNELANIRFSTRNEKLLFRLSVADGKPRYFIYSVPNNKVEDVFFADSRKAKKAIGEFKVGIKSYNICDDTILQAEC